MSRRILVFCLFALLGAAVFVRLGAWQLERLHERRESNAGIAAQQLREAEPARAFWRDTVNVRFRAARVDGRYDYDNEIVLMTRTRRGSPGVEFLTPVRLGGTDTAIMVNRGWVYSPDARSADRKRWREGDSAAVAGHVVLYVVAPAPEPSKDPRSLRYATFDEVQARVPYPIAPFILVATGDTADLAHPARRALPVLGDGPHGGYAFQWFSFAAIALIGAAIVVFRERQARSMPHT